MGTPTQVCVWSCPNFSAPAGRPFRCVKSKVRDWYWKRKDVTQWDWSSRVPVPLPEDPYEAIRQAYLDGTEIESEPFEDPIDIETPKSPLAIAPPILLSESTPPVLVPILCRTVRMAVRVPHVMSLGLSASMAEVEAMCEPALLEDSKEEDNEEDEEIEESMDSDSVSEDAEDEGPTTEDEDLAAEDEGLTPGVEGLGMDDEGYGLDNESRGIDDKGHSVESDILGLEEEEEAVPGGQQQAALVVGTIVSMPLGLGYGALRRRKLALEEGDVYSTFEVGQGFGSALESERPESMSAFRQPTLTTWTYLKDGMIYIDILDYPPAAPPVQTPPSPEWTSGSLPISPSLFDDPSPISSPIIPLIVPSPGGLISDHAVRLEELSSAMFERYDRDIGELFTRSRVVREEIFSQRYRFRSMEYEQERVAVTFKEIWRPGDNRDLRLQLAEERCARLELAEVVNGMRRGQEPRGGA
ncbi:hypothetical protein Tco_1547360 [Tanacetum coccineum]